MNSRRRAWCGQNSSARHRPRALLQATLLESSLLGGTRLTPPSSGRSKGRFAPFGPPLMSNVRPLKHHQMKLTPINSELAPKAAGGYSQAVEVTGGGRWLFISGQIPESGNGVVPEGFVAQARLVWSNVLAQLSAAGMAVGNLAKVTIFLSSREFAAENREIRQEVLGSHAPALTVIITGIFDEQWLLEVEAVAVA